MSESNREIARFANVERRLCGEAGPALAAVIHSLASRDGVFATEIRVTIDWNANDVRSIVANCTIVAALAGPDADRARAKYAPSAPGSPLSTHQS